MQVRTLNMNKMINFKHLKPVTSHLISGPGSLFDPDIFGDRTQDIPIGAYINLGARYIDPATYSVSSRIWRELQYIVDGTKKYIIDDNGSIKEDPNGDSGIEWLYENFDKIQFSKIKDALESNRTQGKLMKKAFLKLKKDDIFINKFYVIPLRYRDLDNTSGDKAIQVDELNQYYMDLIKLVETRSRLKSSGGINMTNIDNRIQLTLQTIYSYISDRLFHKEGAQRQYGLTRSIDNSALVVITSPEVGMDDTIGETDHSMNNIRVPLHHIINAHPTHTLSAVKHILAYMMNIGALKISEDDIGIYYNDDTIIEHIKNYYEAPSLRLIEFKDPNGNNVELIFEYTNIKSKGTDEPMVVKRPITWMEILYLATQMYINNSRGIITRYPVTDKSSIVTGKMLPSTMATKLYNVNIYANDEDRANNVIWDTMYKFPNLYEINKSTKAEKLPTIFEEAIKFNNTYLSGLDGDYDGDKVVLRTVYSEEAVNELDKYMNSPIAHLNVDGSNIRMLTNECIQGLWNLTTDKYSSKVKSTNPDLSYLLNNDKFILGDLVKYIQENNPMQYITYNGERTTLGRLIFNRVVFAHIWDNHEYINTSITKGVANDILNKYATMIIDDSATWYNTSVHLITINMMHDLGFGICDILGSSLDYDMLVKDDEKFNTKFKELFKNMDEFIEHNNAIAVQNAENEMINFMKNHYRDNQMSDLYDSGAKPSWNNDLKQMKVGLGVTPIPGSSDFTILKSNLKDGIAKDEILPNANLQIYGAYNRAVNTAKGGYLTKRMYAAFQSTVVYNRSCNTDRYLEINTNDRNTLLFRYIKTKDGLVLIDNSNIDKFLNKDLLMRSPIFCVDPDGICRTCTGELLFKLHGDDNVDNILGGLFIADIGNELLNKFMKKTHDMGQKLFEVDNLDEYLI